jgi:hypothetical protein
MERLLICVALVLGCRAVQASSVAAVAQEQATQAAKASEGAAGPTKPGIADGASSPDEMGNRRPLYRLRKSDVIEIKLNFASEFNQTVSLQADGFIPLKGWDELYAQAMPELRRTIRQAYSECGPTHSFLWSPRFAGLLPVPAGTKVGIPGSAAWFPPSPLPSGGRWLLHRIFAVAGRSSALAGTTIPYVSRATTALSFTIRAARAIRTT